MTVNKFIKKLGTNLYYIFRALRVRKVIPVLFVLLSGSVIVGQIPSIFHLSVASIFILIVAFLGNELNIIADAEIDKYKKPHLFRWLTQDNQLLRNILRIEVFIIIIMLIYIFLQLRVALAVALLSVAVFSLLYSYNFLLPRHGVQYRLKVFWWGHALSMIMAYFSVWFSGYLCSLGAGDVISLPWVRFFVALALLEYSVFLVESAGDAKEEKEHYYHTLAALLGYHRTTYISIVIWLIGAFLLVFAITQLPVVMERRYIIIIALLPAVIIQGLCCGFSIVVTKGEGFSKKFDKFVDTAFWASRLFTLLILLGAFFI